MFRRSRAAESPSTATATKPPATPRDEEAAAVDAAGLPKAPLGARQAPTSQEVMGAVDDSELFDQTLEDLRGKLKVQLAASSACIESLERCTITDTLKQMKTLHSCGIGSGQPDAYEPDGDGGKAKEQRWHEQLRFSMLRRWRRLQPPESSRDHSTLPQTALRRALYLSEICNPIAAFRQRPFSFRRLLPFLLTLLLVIFALSMLQPGSNQTVVVVTSDAAASVASDDVAASTGMAVGEEGVGQPDISTVASTPISVANNSATTANLTAAAAHSSPPGTDPSLDGLPCTPIKRGDLANMHCSDFCDPKLKRFHCTLCKCRACTFCVGLG